MRKCFVVAATRPIRGGYEDHSEEFLKLGRWKPLCTEDELRRLEKYLRQIEIGDWLAIKRMCQAAPNTMRIMAIGRVIGFGPEQWELQVEWFVLQFKRAVTNNGCIRTISKPFSEPDEWVREAFSPLYANV